MKVVFETATIADSMGKASRVAPTKGSAFDKAAGIVMKLDSKEKTVMLRATNLDIYYLEIVDAVEVEGDAEWRFPSTIIAPVLAKLPIGSGKTVTFEGDESEVTIKAGRTTCKLRTIDRSYFPHWEPFDPDLLEMVPDLGARIQQVQWAAEDSIIPICGVHLDGQQIIATDRFRMARAECEAEKQIYRPITVPAGILNPLMKNLRDVAVGIDDGHFLLMPDPQTQIKTVIFGEDYPNLTPIMKRDYPVNVKLKKQALLDMIDRAMVFGQRDRTPSMTMIFGKEEVAVMMSDQEMGLLGDVMEVTGQADHARIRVKFTPKNITEALNAAPSAEVILCYDPESMLKPMRIDGGSGYEAWVMPRRDAQ